MALAPGKSKSAERGLGYFEAKQIRSAWSEEAQKWYFSIIDVIEVLIGTALPPQVLERSEKQTTEGRQSVVRKNRTTENGCWRW